MIEVKIRVCNDFRGSIEAINMNTEAFEYLVKEDPDKLIEIINRMEQLVSESTGCSSNKIIEI